jgi:hypothetical protein
LDQTDSNCEKNDSIDSLHQFNNNSLEISSIPVESNSSGLSELGELSEIKINELATFYGQQIRDETFSCQQVFEYNGECSETWIKKGCKKLVNILKATDDQNRNLILRGIELFGDSFINILLWKTDNDQNFWINMAQTHISSISQLTTELKLDLEIIINEIQEANRCNRQPTST